MKAGLLGLAAVCLFALPATASFADENLNAQVTLRGSEVHVKLASGYSNATLSISGPNGFYAKAFSEKGAPSIDLIRAGGTSEGQYTYEVTAASSTQAVNESPLDNGRGGVDKSAGAVGASTSGSFYANGGIISQAAMADVKE